MKKISAIKLEHLNWWSRNIQKQPPEVFYKVVFKIFAMFTRKHLCWNLPVIKLQAFRPLLKETQTQVSPCEYCKIFKNTYFVEALQTVASEKKHKKTTTINQITSILSSHTTILLSGWKWDKRVCVWIKKSVTKFRGIFGTLQNIYYKAVNYFCKTFPSLKFDRVINTFWILQKKKIN